MSHLKCNFKNICEEKTKKTFSMWGLSLLCFKVLWCKIVWWKEGYNAPCYAPENVIKT